MTWIFFQQPLTQQDMEQDCFKGIKAGRLRDRARDKLYCLSEAHTGEELPTAKTQKPSRRQGKRPTLLHQQLSFNGTPGPMGKGGVIRDPWQGWSGSVTLISNLRTLTMLCK